MGSIARTSFTPWAALAGGALTGLAVVHRSATMPELQIDAGWPALYLAGLLVGIGTRYGSGCTGGHVVCGLSQLSLRSLVATLAFMGAGIVAVFVVGHLWAT